MHSSPITLIAMAAQGQSASFEQRAHCEICSGIQIPKGPGRIPSAEGLTMPGTAMKYQRRGECVSIDSWTTGAAVSWAKRENGRHLRSVSTGPNFQSAIELP
jgi:hypothetical protein